MNKQRPNILFIVADQLRYDCVGANGPYPVRTPNLDRLAGEGMRFTHAFTPIPLCCPARQALIAGRRPETFGALWNFGISLPTASLQPDDGQWPRQLQANGYRSAYLGKWSVSPELTPQQFGYEHYVPEAEYTAFRQLSYPDVAYTGGYFGEIDPVPVENARTHWFADRAIEFLEQYSADDRPWHIRLDFAEPHLPCRPAGKFAEMYAPEDVPEWASFADTFANKPYMQRQQLVNWGIEHYGWEDWAPVVARYYGVISQMDEAAGKVLDALRRLGQERNTLVVFTADHGDMCGGHRMLDKHYVLYDDIVRVPLIVRWPERIAAGSRCEAMVTHMLDLSATMLELVDAPIPAEAPGRSLLPLLRGEQPQWREETVATYNGQQFGLYTQRMIRGREWKYVWNTADTDELYCLHADPGELNNVIGDERYRPIVEEYRRKLYEVLKREGDGLVRQDWLKSQLLDNRKL